MAKNRHDARKKRARRVRYKVSSVRGSRYRLSVFRSARHIYAQVIDDDQGKTILSSSTLDKDVKANLTDLEKRSSGGNRAAATLVGQKIAEKALAADIKQVIFDRGGYLFHGRTRELAEAARAGGLEF
ncbi:50S ribosomal protein L18 [Magnetococcales bacterium HHB-1]